MPVIERLLLTLLLMSAPVAVAATPAASDLYREASFSFDLPTAEQALEAYLGLQQADPAEALTLDYVRAAVLVAELRRGVYEHGELERKARRSLGRSIDKVTKAALEALSALPESSERFRLEADLYAPMIRSSFRGMNLQPKLEEALEKSLALDENNARAWVSLSRRPLFAPAKHGGDPALALQHLDRALALEPDLVQALLYRGAAHQKLGDSAAAEADWARATELNPNTAGARDRLMSIELPLGE